MSTYTIPNVITRNARGERIMDVYSHLLAERIVYLGTAIDSGVANALIAQLLHLEADNPESEIGMYINSEGGDMSAMLAVYDTMTYIKAPVATTCVGPGHRGRRGAARGGRGRTPSGAATHPGRAAPAGGRGPRRDPRPHPARPTRWCGFALSRKRSCPSTPAAPSSSYATTRTATGCSTPRAPSSTGWPITCSTTDADVTPP